MNRNAVTVRYAKAYVDSLIDNMLKKRFMTEVQAKAIERKLVVLFILSPFAKPIRAIGFLFNNSQAIEPLYKYTVTVDSIEKLTGMDFFTPLPDEIENKIEGYANYNQWPK